MLSVETLRDSNCSGLCDAFCDMLLFGFSLATGLSFVFAMQDTLRWALPLEATMGEAGAKLVEGWITYIIVICFALSMGFMLSKVSGACVSDDDEDQV